MPIKIPDPHGSDQYTRIPFYFAQELTSTQVFLKLPDGFSPLERMLLQATGNLQRIMSAYYNVPSRVEIIKNDPLPCPPAEDSDDSSENDDGHENALPDVKEKINMTFERKIRMYFGDKLAYEADSIVSVKDVHTLSLLNKHEFGLGQVFSHLRQTPQFALHAVGRHDMAPGSSFWRDYTLTAPGVIDCYIRETFVEGLFEPYAGTGRRQGVIYYNPSSNS